MDHGGQDHNYPPGQDPMQLAVKAASAEARLTGDHAVSERRHHRPILPGRPDLRRHRGRHRPRRAERGGRPGGPRAGARRPRPGRPGAGRPGGAPRRLRGARDAGRALVRRCPPTRSRVPSGGSTCCAAGCTPTRGPPPRSTTAVGRTCRSGEVVSGVVDPPGPDEVRALVDQVLGGVVVGDFADTLLRAAAFARVAAAGRVHTTTPRGIRRLVVRLGPVGLAAGHPGRPARPRGAAGDRRRPGLSALERGSLRRYSGPRAGPWQPRVPQLAATSGHAP